MAYEKYVTDALVCGSVARGAADRRYLLFTREAGMLWASAQSVREERSKHRYALQDFSRARVALIQGKQGWRVTGSESLENPYFNAADRRVRGYVRHIILTLRRYVHGEEAQPNLYDEVVTALALSSTHAIDQLEVLVTARMLHQLGYIDPGTELSTIFATSDLSEAAARADAAQLAACERAIENAGIISHL